MASIALQAVSPSRKRGSRERLAIVGSGIAGMTAAYLLHEFYDLTVFEANDYIGGHTHTVDVWQGGARYAVDTGFIVYNEKTYPAFTKLLARLGVRTQPTSMSFSVHDALSGWEYASEDLNTLFAQRSNLLRPRFLRMLREIVRFNAKAHQFLESGEESVTLMGFLDAHGFSSTFRKLYLQPMLAAIWSADPAKVDTFPARHFLRFFHNHGLISLSERPQWRVISGGSREYTHKLCAPFRDRIHLGCAISHVERGNDSVTVRTRGGDVFHFDRVILAGHSDDSLALLAEPTSAERAVLGAIPYTVNDVVLHTDRSLLPKSERAFASWNYHVPSVPEALPIVTYHMNRLQGIESPKPFLVTLNHAGHIAPEEVLGRWPKSHPTYSRAAIAAQSRHAELNRASRVHFCGAYWGYGFHEDGVQSAMALARHLGAEVGL